MINRVAKIFVVVIALLAVPASANSPLATRTKSQELSDHSEQCEDGGLKTSPITSAGRVVQEFLSQSISDLPFHIPGWRWHTMSLIREASRLEKKADLLLNGAASVSESEMDGLRKAAEYIVDFNMKGLHKVERDLFFPWAREKVTREVMNLKVKNRNKIAEAFGTIMDQLETNRKHMETLGGELTSLFKVPYSSNTVPSIARTSGDIARHGRSMLQTEDSLLVPLVARLVPSSEQKSFNNRVLMNLGIRDSRLHLVGMHEAVLSLKDKAEERRFEEEIPSLPRMMIPGWKKNLYEPRVEALAGI